MSDALSDALTDQTLRAIRRILRAADRDARSLAATTGLTPSQLRVLQEVGRHDALTATAIATAVRFSQASVTAIVDRLEGKALVIRRRGETDRRQILVSLTPTGRALVRETPEGLQNRFRSAFEALPEWERAMILAALGRVGELLDADDIDPAPLLDTGLIDRA